VVTAAHNACIQELLQEVNVHGKPDRHMRLLTIETESRFGTLWDQEECNQFCSKEESWEAARDEEMKCPRGHVWVKKARAVCGRERVCVVYWYSIQ
jgi:hypothetical protein